MLIHFCSLEEKKDTIPIIVVIEQTEQMINITLLPNSWQGGKWAYFLKIWIFFWETYSIAIDFLSPYH